MGLLRFFPIKDTFITNIAYTSAYTRATGSNFGMNPTLQVYKVTSSFPTNSADLGRSLLQFDFNYLSSSVFLNNTVPASGVQYVLKAFNYDVHDTVPTSFDLNVVGVSGTWDEGIGLDDKNYVDSGYANWINATSNNMWTSGGGDYYSTPIGSQHFDQGYEDLEIDVTPIVQGWLSGTMNANGLMVKLADSCEQNQQDYWRKVFYSRETHTIESIPYLEARWNDVRKDNRGNFALNQPNTLYMYNFVRGHLQNIQGSGVPLVRLQDNIIGYSASYQRTFSASFVETGVYAANINPGIGTSYAYSSSWVDIWTDASGSLLMTGSLYPLMLTGSQYDPYEDFVVGTSGLKRVYRGDEMARISVTVRKDHRINHVALQTASLDCDRIYIEDMYYSVLNNETGDTIIPFGTGSIPYTKMSYNVEGNYFNLDMNSFVPGFTYRLLFLVQFNKYETSIIDDGYVFKVL